MGGIPSTKRVFIDKANTTVVVMVSVAAALVIFSVVATKAFISQATYQNRVIVAKREALNQLKADIEAVDTLKTSYYDFAGRPDNAIGGSANGTDIRDGSNTKLVLDALPSRYDFPGLTTSIEYLLSSQGAAIKSITGVDDEVAQQENASSPNPEPIAMPFQVTVGGDYDRVKNVINVMERSIRPIEIQKMSIDGSQGDLSLTIDAQTYYQPAKSLNITTRVQK